MTADLDITLILGAKVFLHRSSDRPCGCGQLMQSAIVGEGDETQVASLLCARCFAPRGPLPRNIAENMLDVAKIFGVPAGTSIHDPEP